MGVKRRFADFKNESDFKFDERDEKYATSYLDMKMKQNPVLTFLVKHTNNLDIDFPHKHLYPNPMIWRIISYVVRNWSLIKPHGIVEALEHLVELNEAQVLLYDSICLELFNNYTDYNIDKSPSKEILESVFEKKNFDHLSPKIPIFALVFLKLFYYISMLNKTGVSLDQARITDIPNLNIFNFSELLNIFFFEEDHLTNIELMKKHYTAVLKLTDQINDMISFSVLERSVKNPLFGVDWTDIDSYDQTPRIRKIILPPFHEAWTAKMNVIFSPANVPFSFLTMTFYMGTEDEAADLNFE